MGLSIFPDEKYASNTVTAVNGVDNTDIAKLLQVLREQYDVILAGGQRKLAGRIFRIGHLGLVCEKDMQSVLAALDKALSLARRD